MYSPSLTIYLVFEWLILKIGILFEQFQFSTLNFNRRLEPSSLQSGLILIEVQLEFPRNAPFLLLVN